jgi:type I restriction enzyme S subunit
MSQKFGLIPSSEIEEHRLLSESYIGGKICQKNDIVLNRLKAHLGVFALAPQEGVVSPDYTIFRPIDPIYPRYFELLLRTPACRVELRKRAKGIVEGFWRLYTDDFYNIYLPVPPLHEQKAILDFFASKLEETNRLVEITNKEIELIRDYYFRLTADIVTGKLDVHETTARLPEEIEKLEAAEDEEILIEDVGDLADAEPDEDVDVSEA